MSNSYSLTITMPAATVTTLCNGGFNMYAFKAASGPAGGKPVVWFSSSDYSETTRITWSEQYYAYTSTSTDLGNQTEIGAWATCPINLGQQASVTAGGVLTVTDVIPNARAIAISNTIASKFSCGIAVQHGFGANAVAVPTCKFLLDQKMVDEIVPIEQVS